MAPKAPKPPEPPKPRYWINPDSGAAVRLPDKPPKPDGKPR